MHDIPDIREAIVANFIVRECSIQLVILCFNLMSTRLLVDSGRNCEAAFKVKLQKSSKQRGKGTSD